MEKDDNKNLKQIAIDEQDILVYFSHNAYEEILYGQNIEDGWDISYRDFDKKFLAQNLDIFPQMSMNNLVVLLGSTNEQVKQTAKEQIMKKFRENGEHVFSGENSETMMFDIRSTPWDRVFARLDKEDLDEIKQSIMQQLNTLKEKDPNVFSIVSKLNTYPSLDNFLSSYDEGKMTPEKMEVINHLIEENPNHLKTLNFRIFDDEIFDMGEAFVSRIAKFPNFSYKLIKLAKNNSKLFSVIKDGFSRLEQNQRIQEATAIEADVLAYATRKCFSIQNRQFEDIANCAIRERQLDSVISVGCPENYEETFQKACDASYEKSDFRTKKKILFSKYLGLSTGSAEDFYRMYGKNANQISIQDENLKNYIKTVEYVLQLQEQDVEALDQLYHSMQTIVTPLERMDYEDVLQQQYTKTFSKAVQETDDKIGQIEDVKYIEFQGKKVKQIHLNGKFSFFARSTDSGFKGEKKIQDHNFLKTWKEQKDPSTHLDATCFMTQDFMGHIPAHDNGVLAVYTNVETDSLSMLGPTDINSHVRSYAFHAGNAMLMTAQNLPQNARRVYAEAVIEKQKPNAFLIFDDTPQKVLENTYQAALEFGVPVIFQDKKEIEKQQLENLDHLMQTFRKTKDIETLKTLVSTYETNVAGWLLNRDVAEPDDSFTADVNHERFRENFKKKDIAIYTMITEHVQEVAKNEGNTSPVLQEISKIMQQEMEKYTVANANKIPISKTKMQFNAKGILKEIEEIGKPITQDQSILMGHETLDLINFAEKVVSNGEVGLQDLQNLRTIKLQKEQLQENGEVTYDE